MVEDDNDNCPICFRNLKEQPDGISQGEASYIHMGCCQKRLHAMCWDRCDKIRTWTEDKTFDSVRHLLQPDTFYEARKCPFCRKICDFRTSTPNRNMNSGFNQGQRHYTIHNHHGNEGSTTSIGLVIDTSEDPTMGLELPADLFVQQLLEGTLGDLFNFNVQPSSTASVSPHRAHSHHRPRHIIHPYTNEQR